MKNLTAGTQRQLNEAGLTAADNGYGHRIAHHCGWATTGIPQRALDHAEECEAPKKA